MFNVCCLVCNLHDETVWLSKLLTYTLCVAFRSISLADKNNLLHEELSQSEQVILCLREDLKEMTSDWTTVVKEMGQRKSEVCFFCTFFFL